VSFVPEGKRKKKRISRLLEMVLLVQSRPDWRPKKLAEHFGVSQTRIHQDIKELVTAGVPICFSGEGYKLAGGCVLGSTTLSAEEVLELLYPKFLFAADSPGPSRTLLQAKLAACLPAGLRGSFEERVSGSRIKVESATRLRPTFRRLHDAVAERRRVRVRYASRSSGRTTERELDPYALIFRKHSWYLIAKCHTRQAVRKFRMSRILSVMFTALCFAPPGDFSLEEYTRGWWNVFGGERVNVAVRFSRRVADLIRDLPERAGQTLQELPGGDIIYRVTVRGTREVGWWILQYGSDAEVLEPKILREQMRCTAERMLRVYARRPAVAKVAESFDSYSTDS